MKKHVLMIIGTALLVLFLASCGGHGGQVVDPPDTFDRLTATVQDGLGNPLPDLSVRVEGQDTGKATDANGMFTLFSADFPRGVVSENELSFGRHGIVVGTMTVVPIDNPDLTIQFGGSTVVDNPGSIAGNIYNEKTGETLDGVDISLFSENGTVLIGTSDNGSYRFDDLAAGNWRLSAYHPGYHPQSASVRVEENQQTIQHLALTPEGTIGTGDGLLVRGFLLDRDTRQPVSGATITMYADTGYVGIEPMPIDMDNSTDPSGEPGIATDPDGTRDSSQSMPWIYDPQYQETTTQLDGYFEFSEEVIGYSLWLDFQAESYLNGNHYEYIEGRTGVLDLELEITPFVPTDISGTITDEFGEPVKGAYVEFIYSGGFANMPGVLDWDRIAENGDQMFEEIGAPPPTSDNFGSEDDWQNMEGADGAMPALNGAEEDSEGDPASNDETDNEWMMRFRFENRNNNDREGSQIGPDVFTGYYSAYSGEDGTFLFEGVPAGNYYVFASAYRHLTYDGQVEIVEDPAENVLDITLPNIPVGSVEGRVTDENGDPIDDVLVNATQPFADPFTYTDASGNYRIDNIPVGVWLVSGFKTGYLTTGTQLDIQDEVVLSLDLVLETFEAPPVDTIPYTGTVVNGFDNSHVAGADLVFTPVDVELGGYFKHLVSDTSGGFATQLVPTEYNVLIIKEGFEDIYIRIFVDTRWPTMDFWMWPIGEAGGGGRNGGPWGGIEPMFMDGTMEGAPDSDGNTMPDMPPPE